ncbi:hypothetical protein DFJ73DRAFT_781156 [Zopfochytrium polystomum]|nr:hypothetical protein DFJ73DRAFT_781156 [Zopfochytrium polystomum]
MPSNASSQPAPPTTLTSLPTETRTVLANSGAPRSSTFLADFLTHGVLTDPSHIESAKIYRNGVTSSRRRTFSSSTRKRALPKLRSLRLLQTAAFLDRKDVVDWLMENHGLASLRSVAGKAFDDSAWELAAASGETKTLHALESLGARI